MRSNTGVRGLDIITEALLRIPGLSLKTARKAAIYLGTNKQMARSIHNAIYGALDNILLCDICHNIDDSSPCRICSDSARDFCALCVVEGIADIISIEKSHQFHGKYHVIGGVLSALNRVTPDKLNISSLHNRIKGDTRINEIVLVFGGSMECQNTAMLIYDIVQKMNEDFAKSALENGEYRTIRVSRPASGMPLGAELEYIDEGTLGIAMRNREYF